MLPSRRRKTCQIEIQKAYLYEIDRSLHSHIFKGVCDISLFVYEKKQICTYFPDHAVVVSTIKYKGKFYRWFFNYTCVNIGQIYTFLATQPIWRTLALQASNNVPFVTAINPPIHHHGNKNWKIFSGIVNSCIVVWESGSDIMWEMGGWMTGTLIIKQLRRCHPSKLFFLKLCAMTHSALNF